MVSFTPSAILLVKSDRLSQAAMSPEFNNGRFPSHFLPPVGEPLVRHHGVVGSRAS